MKKIRKSKGPKLLDILSLTEDLPTRLSKFSVKGRRTF
jgi:hypothetical protein